MRRSWFSLFRMAKIDENFSIKTAWTGRYAGQCGKSGQLAERWL
ncbi:hypothetical protein HMPREF3156_00087 [Neisseria sp. HMSC06F02]|nr:hypothetical protein HMPREF3156_00087 [Neisseria sp. HMSC06F02]